MGFLDTLGKILGNKGDDAAAGEAYSRTLWRKKLARILDKLPESQTEWEPLLSEARSLNFDTSWVEGSLRAEFSLLLRRAVADGVVTGMEHRKLDLARDLIGMTEQEAESLLHTVAAEAEQFFGKQVKGT
jgi:hypothetical protein